jgi:hypothetical protein
MIITGLKLNYCGKTETAKVAKNAKRNFGGSGSFMLKESRNHLSYPEEPLHV